MTINPANEGDSVSFSTVTADVLDNNTPYIHVHPRDAPSFQIDATQYATGGDAIQDALDKLPQGGGEIFVPSHGPDDGITNGHGNTEDNVWEVTSTIDAGTTNYGIHIRGAGPGWGSDNKSGTALICTDGTVTEMLKIPNGYLSTVRDIRLDGAGNPSFGVRWGTGTNQNDFKLINSMVQDCAVGLNGAGTRNLWVLGNWIERNSQDGVEIAMTDTIWIDNHLSFDNANAIQIKGNNTSKIFCRNVRSDRAGSRVIDLRAPISESWFRSIHCFSAGDDNAGQRAAFHAEDNLTDVVVDGLYVDGDGSTTKHAAEHTAGSTENVRFKNVFANGLAGSKYNSLDKKGVLIDGASPRTNHGGLPTYTGDGTTGRSITLGFAPTYVAVRDSGGAWYDVHAEFGNGYQHNSPSGELSIASNGFTVGDNSGDADPNTNTETYDVYYER